MNTEEVSNMDIPEKPEVQYLKDMAEELRAETLKMVDSASGVISAVNTAIQRLDESGKIEQVKHIEAWDFIAGSCTFENLK